MSPFIRRSYVDGRWGQVHVRVCGDTGAPAVVLLHQSPLSSAMFTPAMPALARAGLQAIAVDTPGFGLSDPPPEPVSIADYAAAMMQVLDGLGLERPTLLGHHTGASIAAAFAAAHPERMGKLILNGVALLNAQELAHFQAFNFGPILPAADGSHLLAAWNTRLKSSPGWTDLDAMHKHVVEMLRINQTYWWGFKAALAYDIAPDLKAVTCPALILTNTGEDLYAASLAALALRPDFAFVALEGGTHDIVDEQPEAWAAAVAAFVLAPENLARKTEKFD